MSWFFGGSSSNNNSNSSNIDNNDQYDSPSPYQEHAYDNHQEFVPPSQQFSSPSLNSGATDQFREQLLLEQQKILVQQIMFNLADSAFETCIQKPSSSLSSTERSCITAISSKYLGASEFIQQKIERANK